MCTICLPLYCHKSVKLYVCWMCLHCFLQQDTFMGLMSDEEFWMSLLEGLCILLYSVNHSPTKVLVCIFMNSFGKYEWLIWLHWLFLTRWLCAVVPWRNEGHASADTVYFLYLCVSTMHIKCIWQIIDICVIQIQKVNKYPTPVTVHDAGLGYLPASI